MSGPSVRVVKYVVSCLDALPADDLDKHSWDLTVEERAPGRWVVSRGGFCLRRDGQMTYESNPSSRTDRFKRAYRFDLDTALALARKYAPRIKVNGLTAAQLLEWKAARSPSVPSSEGEPT